MDLLYRLIIFGLSYFLIAILKAFRDCVKDEYNWDTSIFSKYSIFIKWHNMSVPYDDWHVADGTIQGLYVFSFIWLLSESWWISIIFTPIYLYGVFYNIFNLFEENLFRK